MPIVLLFSTCSLWLIVTASFSYRHLFGHPALHASSPLWRGLNRFLLPLLLGRRRTRQRSQHMRHVLIGELDVNVFRFHFPKAATRVPLTLTIYNWRKLNRHTLGNQKAVFITRWAESWRFLSCFHRLHEILMQSAVACVSASIAVRVAMHNLVANWRRCKWLNMVIIASCMWHECTCEVSIACYRVTCVQH